MGGLWSTPTYLERPVTEKVTLPECCDLTALFRSDPVKPGERLGRSSCRWLIFTQYRCLCHRPFGLNGLTIRERHIGLHSGFCCRPPARDRMTGAGMGGPACKAGAYRW